MPKLDYGFVAFSHDELALMRDCGICIYCDFQKTCQILSSNQSVMASWKTNKKDLRILITICSECKVLGKRTYGVRGSD